MARIRTVKPELWTDPEFVSCSPLSRLLFIGSLNFCDDYGVLPDDPIRLKLQILPADPVEINKLISELIAACLWAPMTTQDGSSVLVIRSFVRHQHIDKRSVGRWGTPDTFMLRESPPISPDLPRSPPIPRTRITDDFDGTDTGVSGQTPPVGSAVDNSFDAVDNSFDAAVGLTEVAGVDPFTPHDFDSSRESPPIPPDSQGKNSRKGKERKGKEGNYISRETKIAVIENKIPPGDTDSFVAFWNLYPRKVAKGAARRSWTAAAKKAHPSDILAGLQEFVTALEQEARESRFIPHPATWLNGERWADEIDESYWTMLARFATADESAVIDAEGFEDE